MFRDLRPPCLGVKPMASERQMKNTPGGLLRRTGPATAELLNRRTGDVHQLDAMALTKYGPSLEGGREILDRTFAPVNGETNG